MDSVLITDSHISEFHSVVGEYVTMAFDMGWKYVPPLIGIGVLLVIIKILIQKL